MDNIEVIKNINENATLESKSVLSPPLIELVSELNQAQVEVEKKKNRVKYISLFASSVFLFAFIIFAQLTLDVIQKLIEVFEVASNSTMSLQEVFMLLFFIIFSAFLVFIIGYSVKIIYNLSPMFAKNFIEKSYLKFEKLLRKTSEVEEFSSRLTPEEHKELRAILKEATKTYNDLQKILYNKKLV